MAKTAFAHVGDDLHDRVGQKIGTITDVIYDDRTLEPRWYVVKSRPVQRAQPGAGWLGKHVRRSGGCPLRQGTGPESAQTGGTRSDRVRARGAGGPLWRYDADEVGQHSPEAWLPIIRRLTPLLVTRPRRLLKGVHKVRRNQC
jgi:hypothetical protein